MRSMKDMPVFIQSIEIRNYVTLLAVVSNYICEIVNNQGRFTDRRAESTCNDGNPFQGVTDKLPY